MKWAKKTIIKFIELPHNLCLVKLTNLSLKLCYLESCQSVSRVLPHHLVQYNNIFHSTVHSLKIHENIVEIQIISD